MKWPALIAVTLGAVYVLYSAEHPTCKYRYRLTIDVDVGGRTVTGSGVIQVSEPSTPHWLRQLGSAAHIKGEAVTVDLGIHGPLFVLLEGGRFRGVGALALGAFRSALPQPGFNADEACAILSKLNKAAELKKDQLPRLVTFRDPNIRGSAVIIDPDDMEAAFGPGVHFAGARIELTKDAVTSGNVESKLPWLRHLPSSGRIDATPESQLDNMVRKDVFELDE